MLSFDEIGTTDSVFEIIQKKFEECNGRYEPYLIMNPSSLKEFITYATFVNSINVERKSAKERDYPPPFAEFLCAMLIVKKNKDAFLGDLSDEYKKNHDRYGRARADRLYWAEVLRSLGPLFVRWAKRVSTLGVAGLIGKWLGT